jgi:hypothetical protein
MSARGAETLVVVAAIAVFVLVTVAAFGGIVSATLSTIGREL